jgi:ribosomal protein S18 acetylase RimI-like enzyme
MALDLAALPTEPDPPIERFRIEPIRDEEAFRAYLRVVGADRPEGAPPLPPGTADLMVRHVVPSLGREAVPGRFLGRLDGRPVATSRLSSAAGVAGLYSVVTLAEARGRGIGRAMTLAALYAGRDAGLTIATLQSSDMGLAIYRRLGFREVFRYGIYVRYPPGSDAPA